MPIYILLLRGTNLGSHNRMKMDRLRKSFGALGFEQVQTYIQSGNIIFSAAKLSPVVVSQQIEEKILTDFGFSVSVVTRTSVEMNVYSETKLSNGCFETVLSVRATTRNWKTVNKIYEMALECS